MISCFNLDTLKIFFSETSNPIYTKFGLEGPWVLMSKICVRRSRPLSKMAVMDSDWLRHFRLLLKKHCMDDHQTLQKCLSSGPEEVLLLFVAIGNPRWPPWSLIGWDIFDLFSRTSAWMITKLFKNVCLVVLKKCCYFSSRSEIQNGRLGLWLAETFSTCSQEPLHRRSPNFPKMFAYWSLRSVATFRCDRKSKMAALGSDWLRHFWLLLRNHCMDDHQTSQKCLSTCPEEVLLLYVAIGNPRWLPCTLIGWDIFDFFSRIIAWTITKLSTNVCLVVLKKCCYFSLRSEIQDGCFGLWLAETFSTSSQEPLHGQSPNFPEMFA